MSWSNSDEIEEIFHKAHTLGIVDDLRHEVSKMRQPRSKSSSEMLPLYERAFKRLLNTLDY